MVSLILMKKDLVIGAVVIIIIAAGLFWAGKYKNNSRPAATSSNQAGVLPPAPVTSPKPALTSPAPMPTAQPKPAANLPAPAPGVSKGQ